MSTDWQSLLAPSVKSGDLIKIRKASKPAPTGELIEFMSKQLGVEVSTNTSPKSTTTRVSKQALYTYDPDLDSKLQNRCVRGNFDNPELMVVTESPTLVENYWNFAHCGDAGILLTTALKNGGADVGNFFDIFDSVRKYLRDQNLEYNEEIRQMIENEYSRGSIAFYHVNHGECVTENQYGRKSPVTEISDSQYFKELINFHQVVNLIKPKHLILLGGSLFEKVIGKRNVSAYAGITFDYVFPSFLVECIRSGNSDPTLLSLYTENCHKCLVDVDVHPAFVITATSQTGSWETRLKNVVHRIGKKQEMVPVKSTVFTKFDEAKNFLQSWIDDPTLTELSYDWETISLEPCAYLEKSITVTFNVSRNPNEGYVIPTWHKDVDWTMEQRLEISKLIGQLLLKPREATYGHNLLFDNLVSRRDPYLGIGSKRIPGRRIDTMIVSYILDESGTHSLKELCNIHTDLKNYDSELDDYKKSVGFSSKNNYGEIPLDILGRYGAYDAVATLRLYNVLIKLIGEEKRSDLKKVMRLMEVQTQALEDLPFWGQKIDREFVFRLSESHSKNSDEAKRVLFESTEMKDFIELRVVERAAEFANQEIVKPLNCTKLYSKLHPDQDRKWVRNYFNSLKVALTSNQVKFDEDLHLKWLDSNQASECDVMAEEVYLEFSRQQYERDTGVIPNVDRVVNGKVIQGTLEKYAPNLNTNGSGEMGRFFYEFLKLPIEFKTEKGGASLNSDAMSRLAELYPAAKEFSTYKDIEKERSTYINPLVDAFESFDRGINPEHGMSSDGICHYKVYLGKTVTGRTSADLIQLIPREGSVKKFFKSRFPNGFIIQNDLSQIELRIFAAISGDTPMIQTYLNGEDLHLATTKMLYGERFDSAPKKQKKEMRTAAKKTNFGLVYGTSAKGLMQQIKKDGVEVLTLGGLDINNSYERAYHRLRVSKDDLSKRSLVENVVDEIRINVTRKILDTFFSAHPRITEWLKEIHQFASDYGYSLNPFGRIRRLPNALNPMNKEMYAEALRQAQNFPVQSAASDIAVVSLAAIEKDMYSRNLNAVPMLAVHDMVGIDCPADEVVEVCSIMKYWMDHPVEAFEYVLPGIFNMDWLTVPIESDLELGPNWGESYHYKDGQLRVVEGDDDTVQDEWISVNDLYEWKRQHQG